MVREQVLAAKRGDQAAFRGLVETHQRAATAVALSIVRNVAQSEDVAQQAFVQAWKHMPMLKQPDSFVPWLLQLVRREALQALRSNKRLRAARDGAWQDVQPNEHESPAETLERRSMYENLYASLPSTSTQARPSRSIPSCSTCASSTARHRSTKNSGANCRGSVKWFPHAK